jgi:glucokinase
MTTDKAIIGVDMGGTNLNIGVVNQNQVISRTLVNINNQASEETIVQQIIKGIHEFFDSSVAGIGIGVPSLVDVKQGIVYNVQNIPSWREVHLKKILEEEFHLTVFLNNYAKL